MASSTAKKCERLRGGDLVGDTIRKLFGLNAEDVLDEDAGPGDIPGWDSLGHLELFNLLQERLEVEFDLDEIAAVDSVKALRRLVTAHQSS